MSIGGGNAAMTLDFMVNTTMLDQQLAAAEQKVARSAARLATQTDKFSEKWGSGMEAMLMKYGGPMFAVSLADRFARAFGDAIAKNKSFASTIEGLYYDTFASIPVVGAITELQRSYRMPKSFGGQTATSLLEGLLMRQEFPVPEQFGGGVFRLGKGPGTGFQAASPEVRAVQLEARIQRLQMALATAAPARTFEELMSEQMARMSAGGMGQVSTALGTYKFATNQSAAADMVAAARKQVEIQMELEKTVKELADLVKTEN